MAHLLARKKKSHGEWWESCIFRDKPPWIIWKWILPGHLFQWFLTHLQGEAVGVISPPVISPAQGLLRGVQKPLLNKSFLPQAACESLPNIRLKTWELGIWSKLTPQKKSPWLQIPQKASIDALEITQDLSPPIRKHRWSPSVTMVVRCLWLSIVVLLFQFFQDGILNVRKFAVKTVEKTGTCQITSFFGGTSSCRYGRMASSCCGKVDKHQPGLLGKRYHKATT